VAEVTSEETGAPPAFAPEDVVTETVVTELVAVEVAEPPDTADLLVLATRLALGLTAIAGDGLASVARGVLPAVPVRAPRALAFGAGAAVGLGLELQRRTLAAAGRTAAAAGPVGSFARRRLEPWYRRGIEEQRLNRELADRFWRILVAELVAAVVAEVDLDAVAERIDLDRLAGRIDVNAIAGRVDIPRLTHRAIDEVEIGELIRDSTSSLADESVETLRVQGMDADRWLNRLVDRLLQRRDERRTRLDG
jgi:hypothetical protein